MAAPGAEAPGAGRYELRELIGKGSFGSVHRGYDTVTQREVAIKLIDLEDVEEDIEEIQREIGALKGCQSPAITAYFGSQAVPGTSQLMIVMELMAASAADLVSEETAGEPLPEPCIAYVLRQVLTALAYLHGQQRIHRDVKAANILLGEDGGVKVSDFGVSAQLSGTVGFKRRTFVGSPLWMAPEVIEQSPDNLGFRGDRAGRPADGYDEAADIWSLGITAMELACGEPPRADVQSFRLLFMIVRDDPPQLEGAQWSTDFRDFVWQCLRKDPAERPSALDLLEHPFVAAAERPPELAARVADFLQRRPALLEKQQQRAAHYGTIAATAPRWDFGGGGAAAAAGANGCLSGGGTLVARSSGAQGAARAAAAADAEFGGTVVRRHADAALPGQGPPVEFADTVMVRPVTAGPTYAVTPPPRLVLPGDGDRPAAASSHAAAAPAAGAAAAAGAARQLLQAGLQAAAAAPSAAPGASAAADTAAAALGQLEAARPGAARDALAELLMQLSVSSSPSLAGLKGSAEALFGGGGSGSGGSDGPELGPLGRFLMARWREAVARERVQHSQQWQAS